MALTNLDLHGLLESNLHSDTTFTSANLYTYLDLGKERIVRDSPHTLGTKQGTLSLTNAGGRTYDLASDFYQMKSVFYPTNAIWLEPKARGEWVEEIEAQSSIGEGEPYLYCIWGFDATQEVYQIKFNFTPASSYTYYYWYYWMPATIEAATKTSTCPIAKIGYSELLLSAATMSALKRNDPDGYAIEMTNYQRLLSEYKAYRTDAPDKYIVLAPYQRRSFSRLGPMYPAGS